MLLRRSNFSSLLNVTAGRARCVVLYVLVYRGLNEQPHAIRAASPGEISKSNLDRTVVL